MGAWRVDATTDTLLRDLHEWGAERSSVIRKHLGPSKLKTLLDHGYLRRINESKTPLIVLGRRGREHVGLAPTWTTEPSAGMTQLRRRQARAFLEAQGLRYVGTHNKMLRVFTDTHSRPYYLAVSWQPGRTGYSRRSALRLLTTYDPLLKETQGILVIATSTPRRLASLQKRHEQHLRLLKMPAES